MSITQVIQSNLQILPENIRSDIIGSHQIFYFFYDQFYYDISDSFTSKVIPRPDRLKIYTYGEGRSSTKDLIVVMTPTLSWKLIEKLKYFDVNFLDNFNTPIIILHNYCLDLPYVR